MSDQVLSASGEAAWQALRQHIEWEQGFWVGWAFTDHTPSVHELHRRADALLRGVGRGTVLRQPREPSELVDVLLWLNAGADGCDGCVMVAVVNSGEAWRDAWDQLMLRLNERRELLREHIRGGLLLFAPTSFKARSREAAPDLWSIRSLVLDVAPVVSKGTESGPLRLAEPAAVEGSEAEVTLALQAVAAAGRAGQVDAGVEARIRAAKALFAVGRRDEGREQAIAAVEVATSDQASARALVTLANIERQLGDLVAAERHYRAAIDANGEAADVWAYLHLVDILVGSHALSEARSVAEAGLAVSRAKRARGETPEALYEEARAWGRLGWVKEEQGDWSGAGEAFDTRLSLTRLRRTRIGDTTDVLRDELSTWVDVGGVRQVKGDWSGAGEAYYSGWTLSRQVRAMVGDTAQSLRDEAMCMSRLGAVRMVQQNVGDAKNFYETALSLNRRVREIVGDTAQGLRDEALTLRSVGDVRLAQGAIADAADAYDSSLGLMRQIKRMVGATANALVDEAAGLECVGKVRQAQGDWDRAGEAYREGLGLIRQARRSAGDTVRVLEETVVALRFCAQSYRREGKLDSARDALMEAAQLWREFQARCGRLPRILGALAEVLEELREVLQEEIVRLRAPE